MEVLPSTSSYSDGDRQNLEQLLDMFGSVVSLHDIASAYCQAERNLNTASDLLCSLQGSNSATLSPDDQDGSLNASSNCSSESVPENAPLVSQSRKVSASLGTVSGVIGHKYVWSKPPSNEPRMASKPLKICSSDFPSAELWGEKDTSDRKEVMHQDVAEFLYNMLDGFHLDMGIIQDVVGQCGFDVKRSMEKLLDLSEAAFKEDNPVEPSKKPLEIKLDQGRETSSSRAKSTTSNRKKSSAAEDTRDLGKEILGSLFNCSIRIDETEPVPHVQRTMRPRVFGTPVTRPPEEPTETRSFVTRLKVGENALGDDKTEANFEEMKEAAKRYWKGMKEYYAAAIEAYVAGDSENTQKFMEQGQFFMKMAREVNEEAAQMLTETRDDKEYLSMDLQDFEPREVVRLLKIQLTSLCGIESFQYLKLVVLGNNENTIAARRKRVIIKLLERESIGWSEEDSGKIIVIPLGHIDPKKLSFAK